jgi:hypothetical protein
VDDQPHHCEVVNLAEYRRIRNTHTEATPAGVARRRAPGATTGAATPNRLIIHRRRMLRFLQTVQSGS